MMTNVTFSLPDKTVRRLRKSAAESGRGKGAISAMVDDALNTYLDNVEDTRAGEIFTARKGNQIVAQASSLKGLADELRSKRVDPRSVMITTNRPLPAVGHLGFRVRPV